MPIQEKESYRWLESFNDSVQDESNPRDLHLVHVADREADIYELLLAAQAHRKDGMDLLVRSKHNRGQSEKQDRIWDSLSASPERGKMRVSLPRSRGLRKEEIEVSVRNESGANSFFLVKTTLSSTGNEKLGLINSWCAGVKRLRKCTIMDGSNSGSSRSSLSPRKYWRYGFSRIFIGVSQDRPVWLKHLPIMAWAFSQSLAEQPQIWFEYLRATGLQAHPPAVYLSSVMASYHRHHLHALTQQLGRSAE